MGGILSPGGVLSPGGILSPRGGVGVVLSTGRYLVLGGCVSGPGEVYLVPGGCLPPHPLL